MGYSGFTSTSGTHRRFGMSELAEQTTDIEVALTDASGFVLASRLIVAGTDTHLGRQTIGTAEGFHVGANLHRQHRGPDEIDAGEGLQQY